MSYTDPYAVVPGKSYDVLHALDGRLFFCDQKTGQVLDPLGIGDQARSIAVDSGSFYSKVRGRLKIVLDEMQERQRQKRELDNEVKKILDSPPFSNERLKRAEDHKVFTDAMRYSQYIQHSFWVIKNLQTVNAVEPPTGCPGCKDSYDKFMSGVKKTGLENDYAELEKNYDSLDNTFTEYMQEIRKAKPHTPLIMLAGGYEVPEE